jgi:hypothetical protein
MGKNPLQMMDLSAGYLRSLRSAGLHGGNCQIGKEHSMLPSGSRFPN